MLPCSILLKTTEIFEGIKERTTIGRFSRSIAAVMPCCCWQDGANNGEAEYLLPREALYSRKEEKISVSRVWTGQPKEESSSWLRWQCVVNGDVASPVRERLRHSRCGIGSLGVMVDGKSASCKAIPSSGANRCQLRACMGWCDGYYSAREGGKNGSRHNCTIIDAGVAASDH